MTAREATGEGATNVISGVEGDPSDKRGRIESYVAELLLRYPHSTRQARIRSPRVRKQSLDALQQHWALSSEVRDLCNYVEDHRHELQSTVRERVRTDDARIRGRLDARRTQTARLLTGHPTTVVYHEPSRIFATGPNHVLTHVVAQADLLVRRIARQLPEGSGYAEMATDALRRLEGVRRIEIVARAFGDVSSSLKRPGAQALAQAARSRQRLYHLAADALSLLRRVEKGEAPAVRNLLQETLLAPLHTWRSFELATAVAMAEALASELDEPFTLLPIAAASENGILQAGPYRLYWQSQTDLYEDPSMEPSEERQERILSTHGLSLGSDLPDIVVEDTEAGGIVAIAEAKYYTGDEGWKEALRLGSGQLVRYARGYASSDGSELSRLLGCSLVSTWEFSQASRPDSMLNDVPMVVDFEDMQRGKLRLWASRVLRESARTAALRT